MLLLPRRAHPLRIVHFILLQNYSEASLITLAMLSNILSCCVPAVTAFYAECPSKRIYLTSTVESKTRFQGLSVKVQNSGSCKYQLELESWWFSLRSS